MDISLVIPLYNEVESLPELHGWIKKVMEENGYSYEVIFVDDGSNDGSWEIIKSLHEKYENVTGVKFRRNYGKSAGLNVGFEHTKGDVVITMDADMQDSPDEIPDLYNMIMKDGFDLVSGWKKKRYDPLSKTIPTKLYNFVTSKMSGVHLHDMNCGLKAYRGDVVKNIEVYGEMHRYIPVIAKWAGFSNIGEKVVQHRPRKYGVTKFGLSRFIYGPLDLLSIMFMGKFGKRPMHFFGVIGTFIFFGGLGILAWLSADKILFNAIGIANRPAFYLGILMVIVGIQLFIAGFLGELISRSSSERNSYKIT
ncbi:MAG TPA: glycosyltransferase family 2 protein, partial [Saprospiraceae bacterium]|nr:glycosyltransferase family 2 protein [Saprospiraceae bacterium]